MPFFGKSNRKDLSLIELAEDIKKTSQACDEPVEIVILKAIRKLPDQKRIQQRLAQIIGKEEKTREEGFISSKQIKLEITK